VDEVLSIRAFSLSCSKAEEIRGKRKKQNKTCGGST